MFTSTEYGGQNLIFSDSTTTFLEVESEDPKSWMGLHYYNAMSAMDCTPEGETFICLSMCLSVQPSIYTSI